MPLLEFLFGRPLANSETTQERVGPLTGVPILGLDALSSASYGPEAALAVLIPVGMAGPGYLQPVLAVILALLAVLYFSYRQTIAAYPNGGGSYTVAKENLGIRLGLVAAASLLLDYVLNVAVGISAGVGALESALPALQQHTLALCLLILALVTLVNLRGVRDSGVAWSFPTYIFVGSLLLVLGLGVGKTLSAGGHPVPVVPPPAIPRGVEAVSFWLIIRAFASGCTAMTGVEAVSNGVPIFGEPRVKKAQLTLTIICAILGVLLLGIGYLSRVYGIGAMDQQAPGYQSVLAQLVAAVVGQGPLYYIAIASVLAVLSLSANTSFADFPRLCRLLANDGFLPITFASLGRRLVYSTGIIILALLAGFILITFGGVTDRLIPLFAVGAFGAFTFSQAGMVVHWKKQGGGKRRASLVVNACGGVATGAALLVIIVAKFTEGAWITILVIGGVVLLCLGIQRHYRSVAAQIRAPAHLRAQESKPMKIIVLMAGWNCVTEQALRCALQLGEEVTAVHVTDDPGCQDELAQIWESRVAAPAREAGYPPPKLERIESPFRQLLTPLLEFIEKMKEEHPDRMIGVVVPELVQPKWWEYLLHNHAATRLKAALLFKGGERVIVINTPWYLREVP